MYTYWVNDDAFRRNKGMSLDFLLLSARLQAVVTAAGVDTAYRGRVKPSDHTPTWVALRHPT
jgi:exodeoxyribonuclease-3